MASVSELVGQQWTSGDSATASRKYWVEDAISAAAAVALARAVAPPRWGSLNRKSEDASELGGDIYEVTVHYSTRAPTDVAAGDPPTFSFEIGTTQTKLMQSFVNVANYAKEGSTPPDHKGSINVTKAGGRLNVEGVDVFVPTFTWEETHQLNPLLVASYAWLMTAEAMTAKINAAPWRIWAPKELVFLGASGASKGGDAIPVTFKFASSKTRVGISIPSSGGDDAITGITKAGWDYLWVEYEEVADLASKMLTSKPKAVHVEQVYQTADFGILGLATPWA
jgi:hypothetical protein